MRTVGQAGLVDPRVRRGLVRRVLLLAGALALTSCARCGPPPAGSAEELLSPEFSAAVASEPLAKYGNFILMTLAVLDPTPLADSSREVVDQLGKELGFTPFTREGLLAGGVDPDRDVAVVIQVTPGKRPSWTAAIPLSKADLFLQKAEALLQRRAGLPVRTEEARGDVRAIVYSRVGEPMKVALGVVRGYALLSRGEDPMAELAAAQTRDKTKSLATAPLFLWAQKQLAPARLVGVIAQSAQPAMLRGLRVPTGDLALGLTRRPQDPDGAVLPDGADGKTIGLTFRAVQKLSLPLGTVLPEVLPGGLDVLAWVKGAPLRVAAGVRADKLPEVLARTPLAPLVERLRAVLADKKIDLDKDVLGSLGDGVALSAQLSRDANLALATDPTRMDFAGGALLDVADFAVVGVVKDAQKLTAAMDAVMPALATAGITGTKGVSSLDGKGPEWAFHDARGHQICVGVAEEDARAKGPPQVGYLITGKRDVKTLTRPDLSRGRAAASVSLRVNLDELAREAKALPDSSFGGGPQAMVARALVTQVLQPWSGFVGAVDVRVDNELIAIDLGILPVPEQRR
ncbi:MAG: hypothetical protein JST92_15770 [Deltaproteobacteria bacterium]|nr:hypothetical protein [Deltaproteobacteria bacterium]